MKRKSLFLTLAVVLLTLFSCKPPKEFIDGLNVSVNPLEEHAGQVEVTIDGTFPNKYFTKKMTMTVTPVLKSKLTGEVIKAQPKTYQGEKVKGNDQVIKYKVGGKYSQTAKFDYKPGMESSELYLQCVVVNGKKEYSLPEVKVADGVNITPLLVSVKPGTGDLSAAITPDKFQRIIEEKQDAEIRYLINQSTIRNSELKSDGIVALTKAIQSVKDTTNREIKSMEISSYASPDGTLDLNERLSNNRGKASSKYVERQMKKIKAEIDIDSKVTAEDWEGFQKLVESSSIEDKDVILKVLSMYSDPEQREKEIKNLAVAYKTIADEILPQLRRSKMTLTINVIGKSDAEIDSIAKVDAKALNVEELLYAATLKKDLSEKAEIYTKVTEIYPNEARGFNNLGMVRYEQGNVEEAGRCFAKALELAPKCPAINYNNGIIELANGNTSKAEEFFGNAGGVGKGLDYANGVLAIQKAQYKKAVDLYADSKSNNAALANILNKNNTAARNILDNIANPNATTYYLKAIVSARTNDAKGVVDNLKKAIEGNAEYKTKAASDVEFISLAENADFAAIVK